MTQLTIVIIIVALAVAYAAYRLCRTIKDGPSCDCGNCNGCKKRCKGRRQQAS